MRTRARRAWAVTLAFCAIAVGFDERPGARQAADRREFALLEQWLGAVERHGPGRVDAELAGAAAWSGDDLRRLWRDVYVLLEVVVNPKRSRFVIPPFSFEPPSRSRIPLAVSFRRESREALDALAARVRGAGLNVVLRRAAILHTDIVTAAASIAASPGAPGGEPLRWVIGDGTAEGAEGQNLHWELARMVLSRVAPDPRNDSFVRDWYRATIAHGQSTEYFDALHLGHGLKLFPEDPELLLLAGAEREALATPLFQAFARSVPRATVRTGIGSVDRELSAAAGHYRRALDHRAGFAEARLRLGRVLELQGRHAEAVRALREALELPLDPVYQYVGALFLGVALEGAGDFDDAVDAFQRAASLHPGARAPHLALARLARERGDDELTASSLARALAPFDEASDVDPWWLYRSVQGRRRISWLADVRQRATMAEP